MKINQKLTSAGIAHHILPLIVIVVMAVAGVGFMVASHANPGVADTPSITNDIYQANCAEQLKAYPVASIVKFGQQKVANREAAIKKYKLTVTSKYSTYAGQQAKLKQASVSLHKTTLLNDIRAASSGLAAKKQAINAATDQATAANTVCAITNNLAIYSYLGNKVKRQIAVDGLAISNAGITSTYIANRAAYTKLGSNTTAAISSQYATLIDPGLTAQKISALQASLDAIVSPYTGGQVAAGYSAAFKSVQIAEQAVAKEIKTNKSSNTRFAKSVKVAAKTPTRTPVTNTPKPSDGRTKSRAVYVVGDSITEGSKKYLRQNLMKKYKSVKINYSGSRSIKHAGVTGPRTSGLQAVADDRNYIKNADTVIIALGTNYNENFEGSVHNMVARIRSYNPNAKIYWVNIFSKGKVNGPKINTSITKMSKSEHFTIIHTVNKGIGLGSDGVHPTVNGSKKFAQLVANGAKPTK